MFVSNRETAGLMGDDYYATVSRPGSYGRDNGPIGKAVVWTDRLIRTVARKGQESWESQLSK